jgi:hypothetical protein
VTNGRPEEYNNRWYPDDISVIDPNRETDIINLGKGISSIDTEQDWFSFNANGISGTFFFDEQKNIHINCEEYVKIEFSAISIPQWFVIKISFLMLLLNHIYRVP